MILSLERDLLKLVLEFSFVSIAELETIGGFSKDARETSNSLIRAEYLRISYAAGSPDFHFDAESVWRKLHLHTHRQSKLTDQLVIEQMMSVFLHGLTNLNKYDMSPFSRSCFKLIKEAETIPVTIIPEETSNYPSRNQLTPFDGRFFRMHIAHFKVIADATLFASLDKHFYNPELRTFLDDHFKFSRRVSNSIGNENTSLSTLYSDLVSVKLLRAKHVILTGLIENVQTAVFRIQGQVIFPELKSHFASLVDKFDSMWHKSQILFRVFVMFIGLTKILSAQYSDFYEVDLVCEHYIVLLLSLMMFFKTSIVYLIIAFERLKYHFQ